MRHEHSYGIIPLRREESGWQVFLVKHGEGHWSFPKGHPEEGESPRDTAARELHEETGLEVVAFLVEEPLQERYHFTFEDEPIDKVVDYYLAEVGGEVSLQVEEIADSVWMSLDDAVERITFKEGREICRQAIKRIASNM